MVSKEHNCIWQLKKASWGIVYYSGIKYLLYIGEAHCDHMVVGFTTTCAIGAYRHWSEFESHSGEVYPIQHYVIKFKVCQCFAAGQWFSPGTPVSSTNKTDPLDITEILLKVVLNTINLTCYTLVVLTCTVSTCMYNFNSYPFIFCYVFFTFNVDHFFSSTLTSIFIFFI